MEGDLRPLVFRSNWFIAIAILLALALVGVAAITPVIAHDSGKHWHNGHGADPNNCTPGPDCLDLTYNRDDLDIVYQVAWGSAYLAWHGSDILDWTWASSNYDQTLRSTDNGDDGVLGGHRPTWASANHFAHSIIEMNDHYLGTGGQYDDDDWRTYTMCHEMGHGFGLDHFESSNIATSCLNSNNMPNPNTAGSHDIVDLRGHYN